MSKYLNIHVILSPSPPHPRASITIPRGGMEAEVEVCSNGKYTYGRDGAEERHGCLGGDSVYANSK